MSSRPALRARLVRASSLGGQSGLDQILYSASNSLLIILAARQGISAAGKATLLQVFFILSTTLIQGAIVDALVLQRGSQSWYQWRAYSDRASALVGIVAGFGMAAYILMSDLSTWVVGAAVASPFICIHYALRALMLGRRQVRLALISNVVRLTAQVAIYAVLVGEHGSLVASLIAWSASGVVACAIIARGRVVLGPQEDPISLAVNVKYSAELLVGAAGMQGVYVLTAALLSPGTTGIYRTAQLCFAGVNLMSQPMRQLALASMSRVRERAAQLRYAAVASLMLVALSSVTLALWSMFGGILGPAFIGDSWAGSQPALKWVYIESVMSGLVFVPALLLRVWQRLRVGVYMRGVAACVLATVTLACWMLGISGVGFVRAITLSSVVTVSAWYLTLRRTMSSIPHTNWPVS